MYPPTGSLRSNSDLSLSNRWPAAIRTLSGKRKAAIHLAIMIPLLDLVGTFPQLSSRKGTWEDMCRGPGALVLGQRTKKAGFPSKTPFPPSPLPLFFFFFHSSFFFFFFPLFLSSFCLRVSGGPFRRKNSIESWVFTHWIYHHRPPNKHLCGRFLISESLCPLLSS